MMKLNEILDKKFSGLYYGNRVLLPFSAFILKIIVDAEIIMDFSPDSDDVFINETEAFTEIYFKNYENLKDAVSKYESIKLIVVEKDKDIFNPENHRKLALRVGEKHELTIEETDEDILFIE